ncbi:MAG: helix-turn-helix transcriptional regulator [Clostridiaceae bacterium]|nr:helix-turn-helix transcriptional regulator [Clostridiaceae bacterium]
MFFDLFAKLCAEKGVSPKKAVTEMGLSNSIATKWKKTGATPQGDTLQRIADYFDVSVDYLLTGEKKETAPIQKDERSISDDEIKFALFGTKEIDDHVLEQVKAFAKFARENRKDQ